MNYSFEEFMELTPTDLEGTSRLEKNPNILKKLKENKNMVFETKHVAKTGEKYDVEISSKIIKLDNSSDLYLISVARDITDRKKIEKIGR
jgi:PAS domain S-box-containing protein